MRGANSIKVSLLALSVSLIVNIGAIRPASAALISTALSIVVDGSGSISSADFAIQQSAYATVLGNSSILPADGSVVINLIQFSSTAQIEQTAIRVSSAGDRTALLTAINGMGQLGGNTAIGDGINLGVLNMDTFLAGIVLTEFASNFEKIVDVSTDGFNNVGADPATAAQNAATAGYVAVNCLGIGTGANCDFNNGFGADFPANSFAELEPALTGKIQQEISAVPEPATIGLLGIGLFGLGLMRWRKAA